MIILVTLRKNNVRCLFYHKECIFSRPLLWNRFSNKASFSIKVPFYFLKFCSLHHWHTLHRSGFFGYLKPFVKDNLFLSYHQSSLMTLLLSKIVCLFWYSFIWLSIGRHSTIFTLVFHWPLFNLVFLSSHGVLIVLNYNIKQRRLLYIS